MKNFFQILLINFIFFTYKAKEVLAFKFDEDSGLKNTAIVTGHEDLESTEDPETLMAYGINMFLAILGLIFLGLSVYAGLTWMTARGNSDQVDRAKNILRRSIMGLIIILGAFALTAFVMEALL